ncbi:MAG: radical SAM protein [Selenomonadaceae bacterium]|nr:radical SAM protein [Selenomonadaceae bacterium]
MSWKQVEILKSLLAKETGYTIKGGQFKFALTYPNYYRVGMSNLGLHIIYQLLNSRADTSCERFFLPEEKIAAEIERSNSALMSLETQTPLNQFQFIGFSISFEQDYFNAVKILKLGKIKIRAAERTNLDPILIAGGPCATFNPAPLTAIFDAFVIGEGEVILPPLMDVLTANQNLSRVDLLKKISQVEGVYVPAVREEGLGKREEVKRQYVKNLDEYPAHSVIITDDTEFNMYLLETARGCGRHCRFCMAGYCFRRPRNRSLETLQAEIDAVLGKREEGTGKSKNSSLLTPHSSLNKKIGLMGAAISDYPQINELCKYILDADLKMSVASFRADSVTAELVDALAKSGLKTLTVAPEVGSEKMRRVTNKGITEENVFTAVKLGVDAGIKNFKLYFMIGLPFEEMQDVDAIAELVIKLKNFVPEGKFTLSVNPFIPKPFTPFQWSAFADKKYLQSALKNLRGKLKKFRDVEIISESLKSAKVQAILSRGDERLAELVAQSDSPQKFMELFKAAGLDENFYLGAKSFDDVLAWDVINQGVTKKYLWQEFERAAEFKYTPPCFDGCKRCGVC